MNYFFLGFADELCKLAQEAKKKDIKQIEYPRRYPTIGPAREYPQLMKTHPSWEEKVSKGPTAYLKQLLTP